MICPTQDGCRGKGVYFPSGKFCPYCGKPLQELQCRRCHQDMIPIQTFCGNCGTPVAQEELAAAPKEQA